MRSSARKKKLRSFLDPGEISSKEKVFSKKNHNVRKLIINQRRCLCSEEMLIIETFYSCKKERRIKV